MKKIFFSIIIQLLLNLCLYAQANIFTLTHTFDFVSGSGGSITLLPNGGWPDYTLNSVPRLNSNVLIITSNGPNMHRVDPSSEILLNLPNPSTGPATTISFPRVRFPDGRNTGQTANDFFPGGSSTILVASSNSTSGNIIGLNQSTGDLVDNVDVQSESQLTALPINWPQNVVENTFLAINNNDGVPTLISTNDNTNQLVLTPIPGKPPGTDFIPLIRPTIIEDPENNKSVNGISGINANTGYVFYKADDGIHGQELWITDGTLAGTRMVKDIYPTDAFGNSDSFPYDFTSMNDNLYFVAAAPGQNSELWVSDGTEFGTVLVKDINPAFGHSNIGGMININNTLYFRANNGTDGIELWKSDGSDAGTVMIKNINETTFGSSSPGGFTLFNGLIYFRADDGIHGAELWVTNGTGTGTHMVKNINNTGDGSVGSSLILPGLPNGDVFYFYADDGIHGKELWVTDGTSDGTKLAYDIFPGPSNSNNWSGWGLVSDGTLYVSANDGVVGDELFVFANVPSTVPMASCSMKIFLEGPYNSGSMNTTLGTNIPLRQPFNNAEFGHYGDETITSAFITANNIVDWVKVELRSGASAATATTVASKAVLVNNNGDLVDLDGSLDIDFKWVEAGDYYVTVYHRNHLGVLSSGTVTLTN